MTTPINVEELLGEAMTAPNQTPQSTFDEKVREIIDYCAESYYPEHEYGDIYRERNKEYLEEAAQAITSLVLEEVNKAELSDYATFKWLLKDALQPSSDTRKMSRIYLVQELVDKDYDSLAAQQRSIITKESTPHEN